MLLALLAVLFLAPGIFLGQVPIFRDLLVLVLPLRSYAAEAVRQGSLPLWCPDLFLGAPLLADYQSAVLYPPSLILYLVPLPAGFSLYVAFHLFVAGLGMTRYLVRGPGHDPAVALVGGIVFAFGGFAVSLIPLTNQLQVAVWAPWVVDAGEELYERGSPRAFVRLTVLVALQALGGAPEALVLTGLLLGVAIVARLRPGHLQGRRLAALLAAAVLAFGLAAEQLLPTAEYASRTDRADVLGFDAVAAESLSPRSFEQLLLPHRFEAGAPGFIPEPGVPLFWSLYLGIAPLALAVAALARRPPLAWIAALVLAVALALGPHLPLLPLLYRALPRVVGAFRFPAKFFLAAHFAAALLAAAGLARIEESARARRAAVAAAMLIAVGCGTVAVFAAVSPRDALSLLGYGLRGDLPAEAYTVLARGLGATALRSSAVALVVVALFWLARRGRWPIGRTAIALALVTWVETLPIHQPPLVFTPWRSLVESADPAALGLARGDRVYHYCTGASCLPDGAPGLGPWSGSVRIGENVEARGRALWAALVPDVPMVYGLGAVAGSDGFATRDQRELHRALALLPRDRAVGLLAALGVGHLIGTEPLDVSGLQRIAHGAPVHVYRVVAAAPRVYLAERILASRDPRTALAALAAPGFRPGRDAVVVGSEAALPEASGGELEGIALGRERITARVKLERPGLLVISDTFFPGWEATIDAAPAGILRVNGIVRGVAVPAGDHAVEIAYRPQPVRVGRWTSIASGLLLLLVLAVGRRP